jgi:hypothetical protein
VIIVKHHRRQHWENNAVEVFIHLLRAFDRKVCISRNHKPVAFKQRFYFLNVILILIIVETQRFGEQKYPKRLFAQPIVVEPFFTVVDVIV